MSITLNRKNTEPKVTLNQGQQAAAEGFFKFLFSKEKEFILSGAAGVGKTFTMGQLIDQVMPEYIKTCEIMGIEPEFDEVVMTATTNKAAEVLALSTNRPTGTIHSFLRTKMMDDYQTGKSKLIKRNDFVVHARKIIFVDESSMIDCGIRSIIHEGTTKSKIVYVGDHCQLAPVGEEISPIYRDELPFFELTELVRNAKKPALMEVCWQLRQTVETGEFRTIQIVPGVIDHVDDAQMQELIAQTFAQQTREARILAYTNERVISYNDHIRDLRGLSGEYKRGEFLINNNAIRLGKSMLSVEEEVEIVDQRSGIDHVEIEEGVRLAVRHSTIRSLLGSSYPANLPVDRDHYSALVKYYGQKKLWKTYFNLKNGYPDLRPRDAATVHKAQGSTYNTVFVDVGDISKCHQPKTAARLLYVAFSRARSRVILYGDLASKYGGLVT